MGGHHARIVHEHPDTVLVAVVDTDAEKAAAHAAKHGVPAKTDLRALLEAQALDAIVVAVPTAAHAAVAQPALAAGVACLVEKPLAATSAEAQAITDTATRHGTLLQVGHVERFNAAWQSALPHLSKPLFVEGHRLAPFAFRSLDIGVVMDLMIHDLDLLLSLVGEEPESVDAAGVAIVSGNEDIANARIAFPGGCVANLTASRASEKVLRRFRIFSGDSYVSIDLGERMGIAIRKSPELASGAIDITAIDPATVTDRREELMKMLHMTPILGGDTEPLRAQLDAFIGAMRNGTPSPVPGATAVKVLQLAERVLESVARHVAKALPPGA